MSTATRRLLWCLSALLFLLPSCFKPGGGGAIHKPPVSIPRGAVTTLELELSSVHPGVPMDRQMTKITCHYRLTGAPTFIALPMASTIVDKTHLIARAQLPAFPNDVNGSVEYYFTFDFDGHPNDYETAAAPIRVPLQ